MALVLSDPPDGWQERIQEKTLRLLAPIVGRSASGLRKGEHLDVSTPIPIYRQSAEEVGVEGLKGRREVVGWRSLLFSGDRPEKGPLAAVRFEKSEEGLRVTGVQVGDALRPLLEALDGATTHAQTSQAEYGLRLLEVPGLLYGAVLLESCTPEQEDLIFPLPDQREAAPREAITLAQASTSLGPTLERNLEARRA